MHSRFKLHYFYVIVVDQFRVGTVNLFIPKTEQESEIESRIIVTRSTE